MRGAGLQDSLGMGSAGKLGRRWMRTVKEEITWPWDQGAEARGSQAETEGLRLAGSNRDRGHGTSWCSRLHAGEAPRAGWSQSTRKGGGRGAERGTRRSEGVRQGARCRWAGVRCADLMLEEEAREDERGPGLGKEQPVAMAVGLGT